MTLRYKLRTLLILLAILPPLLWVGWTRYAAWKAEQERRARVRFWNIDSGTVVWSYSTHQSIPPTAAPAESELPSEQPVTVPEARQ